MMNKKALFIDLDGTFLDDDKQVPEANAAAVQRMLDAGHSVIISTGRPLSSAVIQAERIGLTSPGCYLIAYNGGILYDTYARKIIYKSTIPLDVVLPVFAEANRRGLHLQTYDETEVLVEPRCVDEELALYCSRILIGYKVIPDIRELTEEPVKMLAIHLNDRETLEEFRRWIAEECGDSLDTFFSNDQYVEIVRKGLNKGNALKQMAELIGVSLENTVAAGDEANDTTLLQAAHIGAAMCNGCEETKAAADYITQRNNNEGGVAEIIEKFIL